MKWLFGLALAILFFQPTDAAEYQKMYSPEPQELRTPEKEFVSKELILSDNMIVGISFLNACGCMLSLYALSSHFIPENPQNSMGKIMFLRIANGLLSGTITLGLFSLLNHYYSVDGKTRKVINLCKTLQGNPLHRQAHQALGLLNQLLQRNDLNHEVEQLLIVMKRYVLKIIDTIKKPLGPNDRIEYTTKPIF